MLSLFNVHSFLCENIVGAFDFLRLRCFQDYIHSKLQLYNSNEKKNPANAKYSKLRKMFVILICDNISNEWSHVLADSKLPSKPLELAKELENLGLTGYSANSNYCAAELIS